MPGSLAAPAAQVASHLTPGDACCVPTALLRPALGCCAPLQALCPWLHCGDADWLGRQPALQLPQQRLVDLKQQVDAAGVVQVSRHAAWLGGVK